VLYASLGCALAGSSPALAAAAPAVEGESVVNVSSTGATLQAQVNPEGSATTYRFEYDTSAYTSSAGHGISVPTSEGDAGSGSSPVAVEAHPQGLAPSTVYHYRLVATGPGGAGAGAAHTITTLTTRGPRVLPDGRQWEMVSPPVKDGSRILPEAVVQAAANGDALTYVMTAPTEENPAGSTLGSQTFSTRGTASGWSSQDIATPQGEATGVPIGNGEEYRFFSSDLSLSLVEPFGEGNPPLSSTASGRTAYIRNDAPLQAGAAEQALYRQAEEEGPGGAGGVGYVPLVTPANVPPGTQFGEKFPLGVGFMGATPDLSHVVLTSKAALTSKASEAGLERGLYEWSGGQLQLVSVLLGAGEPAVAGALGDLSSANARNAISADGSRIFWTGVGGSGERHLYMRDTKAGATVQVDAAQGAPEPSKGDAEFQLASSDGSKVFFTDEERLTAASTAGGEASHSYDLYVCEIMEAAGKPACRLSDLTVDSNAGQGAEVKGVLPGASEDGSYVYLVANGVLAPGAAPGDCATFGPVIGQTCNLYLLHESGGKWSTRFVAELSGADAPDWGGRSSSGELRGLSARVSPNGRYLEFMSERSLTGYDNVDANSGKPDEEIYLYDAVTDRLVCVSCNPSGARPIGVEDNGERLMDSVDSGRVWSGSWLAASVPGWVELSSSLARYQPRYLDDSGRLFFDSVDPLVPQASNGVANVYEYEPSEGRCTSPNATYSAAAGGCVALISAASSGEESVFLDASENGEDVFFMTTARLAPQDLDNAFDVYDAHVCSASAPCAPVTVSPPPCTTADSCRSAPAPQPGVFGAPASATFAGAGNVAASAPVVKAKPKPRKKVKGKSKSRHKRRRRASRNARQRKGA
jgi:hypothetical protein